MKSCLIFFAIVATVAATPPQTDYCELNCHKNGAEIKHIACDNNNKFDPKCPKTATIIKINNDVKNVLTQKFNYMRNLVAGGGNSSLKFLPACRMATIQWDDELADLATLSTKRCSPKSDSCRRTKVFSNPGQYALQINLPANDNVNERIIELFDKQFENISKNNYYTNIFHDGNIHFGCGVATSKQIELIFLNKNYYPYWFICNYATELEKTKAVYKTCKKAGTECKTGRNPNFKNLCSTKEKYN